jgi:large conductance mechanosensitive channel protein
MPLIGLAVGGVDFKELKLMLSDEVLNEAGEVVKAATYMSYGNFLQVTFDFLIIALSIFTVIRLIGKLNRKEEAKAAEPAPKVVVEETNIPLVKLDNHTCRWPLGDPKDDDFCFCGKRIKTGQTYCEEHAAVAYVRNGKKA